jgi:ligand-binding sensor domain-containing protein
MLRMVATGQNVWLVIGERTGGAAMVYAADLDATRPLRNISGTCYSVAATKDAVFFGGSSGLFKLTTEGKLLKRYCQEDSSLPGNVIRDVCEGGGKIYMSINSGIAVLDPATDKVSVLSPSSREATKRPGEPGGVPRLRWDAATPRLYACCYPHWYFTFPELSGEFAWSPREKAWRVCRAEEAPQVVASQGDEAVNVRFSGEQSEFHFLKAGQKVMAAVPAPQLMGEPAWDERRIWVPTASGLYEVDRATGRVSWLAYQDNNQFLSVLKQGGRLYIATSRGLYYREIP